MTTYQQLQTRLQAEPATWLVTGVAGFIGSNLLEALRSNWTLTPIKSLVAVAHREFKAMGAAALRALGKPQHVLFDLKYVLPAAESDLRL